MVGPVHGRTKEKELEKMSMLALNRKKDKARDMRGKKTILKVPRRILSRRNHLKNV